jgi:spermidine synthase
MILITFIVAFCSVVYELLLSEISAVMLGGTFYRYIVTIGIYIFCLGLGSLLFERIKNANRETSLLKIELLLSLFGVIVPALPLAMEAGTFSLDPGTQHILVSGTIYSLIITIGLLSGMELPILMDLAEKEEAGKGFKVLAVDFAGTFLGILAFPLFLMKYLGLFHASILVACLNFVVFLFIARRIQPRPLRTVFVSSVVMLLIVAFNILALPKIADMVF